MDFDSCKPVYVFVLDFSDTGKPANVGDLPADLVSQCRHLEDVTASEDKPVIAVRGSTAPFGRWNVDGVRAASLATDRYAVLINDYLPKDTQYKWLNRSGRSITGDLDPATGYHYEPDPFVDRTVPAGEEVLLGDIVFVFNTWGTYSSTVHKDFLDRWLPDTTTDTKNDEETVEAPVVNDGATKPDTTDMPDIPAESSSDQPLDAEVDIVAEHDGTETETETDPSDEEEEQQEMETSEKEISVSFQKDVAVTATMDTVGNGTEASSATERDEVEDENAVTTGAAAEEKASEEQEVVVDLQNEVSEEAVTSVSETSTDTAKKDEESQTQANDQSSTETPVDEPEDNKTQKEANDAQIKDEASTDITMKSQVKGSDQTSTQADVDESEGDETQEEADDVHIKDKGSLGEEEKGEPKNDESFMVSEEIEMTVTTISSQTVQGGNIKGQSVEQDMENNNTVLSQGKTTETEDVFNANESQVKKLNFSNFSVMSSHVEKVSEATFRRMSRISESKSPEIDQVNEVLICDELSKITVTKGQRIPSSSSC